MPEEPEILGLGGFALGAIALGAYGFTAITEQEPAQGVRFLDASKGDYASRNGTIQRTTSTKQRVINALVHRFGSSSATRGVRVPEVHDANTERFMDSEVRTALQSLLDEGAITVTRIVTKPEGIPGKLGISVEFVDTTTGQTETAEA